MKKLAPQSKEQLAANTKAAITPKNQLTQKAKDVMKKSVKVVAKIVKQPAVKNAMGKVAVAVAAKAADAKAKGKAVKSPAAALKAYAKSPEHNAFVEKTRKGIKADKGAVCGKDAKGNTVHVGDVVNHTEKDALKGGVIIAKVDGDGDQLQYKGENAVGVLYPQGPHLNRLSKLEVVIVH
jgi:hypothetical protein